MSGLRPPPSATRARLARVVIASVVVLLVAGSAVPPTPAGARSVPLPRSMAALGDSLTRAYDVCCWYGDHAGHSWSTGGASHDRVTSQYERLRARDPAIAGQAFNDAVSGARVSGLLTQAQAAVSQHVDYVTVLIGANDLCTSSVGAMTSVEDFRARFRAAMTTLQHGLPRARIFVSSIPSIYRLWLVLHTNTLARLVWRIAGICQSMLASTNTETQRQQVVQRELAFNQVLADVCTAYARCRWDGGATYHYEFTAGQVSSLDYFHPGLSGQAALAKVTWASSWWR